MSQKSSVLITGGAGFIGAQTAKAVHEAGFLPVVIDDLSQGFAEFVKWGPLFRAGVGDSGTVKEAVREHHPVAVIHFAGRIQVGESVREPLLYYRQNVGETLQFVTTLQELGLTRVVFSSSAAVYGDVGPHPIPESAPKRPENPYGMTKSIIEDVWSDMDRAGQMKSVSFRYFNAAGSDADAGIGESHEPETHLIPLLLDAALGRRGPVTVFGLDYPTPDGSCIRDYIHVRDLADAHVRAVTYLMNGGASQILNLGMGQGFSVLDVIAAVERVTGKSVPWVAGERRAGDATALVSDPANAMRVLNWVPSHSSLDEIVRDAWKWRLNRPAAT